MAEYLHRAENERRRTREDRAREKSQRENEKQRQRTSNIERRAELEFIRSGKDLGFTRSILVNQSRKRKNIAPSRAASRREVFTRP
jgi:hypothetical protein